MVWTNAFARPSLAAIALSGAVLVAGCTSELGYEVDEGNFGSPTQQNLLAQSAYLNADGLLLDLGRKFARDVPTMINFAFDSAVLDDAARGTLERQADFIKRYPAIRFRVYGHTDKVGSNGYNQSLGLRRARAAVNYMVSRGVPRQQLEAVVSFGETRPLIPTERRERQNRRTVTEVAGVVRNYAGDDMDGKRAAIVYSEYVQDSGSEITP